MIRILYLEHGARGSLEWSLARSFQRLGCEVTWFDGTDERLVAPLAGAPFVQRVARRLTRPLLPTLFDAWLPRFARGRRFDLVFCHKSMRLEAATLRRVADDQHALLFCFQPDHPFDSHPSRSNARSRALVPLVDCYFTFGRFIMPPLVEAGARRVEFLPFAHDPELHAPPKLSDEERRALRCEVAFVGNHSLERERWLQPLLDRDLGIWGARWDQAVARDARFQRAIRGGPQIGADFARIYAAADIGLNLIQVYPDGHNMRSFEAPACGGFVLSNRTPELLQLFVEDVELACFGDVSELRTKVDHYLRHPEERRRIAEAGHARVINETYDARARRILEVYDELRVR